MSRFRNVVAVGLALTLSSFGVGTAMAGAEQRIGPDQHFVGLVNGSNDNPVVYTVCAGPSSPGRRGPVAGGQTLAVAEVPAGTGDTGLFSRIYAWFGPAEGKTSPRQVKFRTYGTARAIPTSVRVPCDGTGTVTFSSCPYAAPCAAGWVPDDVTVQFVNIAV